MCVEKQKTSVARRTLDPMYQEVLHFQQNYKDKILQITVWGDYGKLDRKVFMGISQIVLNELNLTTMVIGWYKLYSVSSLMTDYRTLTLSHNSSLINLSSTESGYSFDSNSVKTTQ
jgi:regulating synaptic membrane exocytosis protein 2